MSDPWSQFAAGRPAAAQPRHLAYVDADSVGFDVRMPLPACCLTCGATERLSRVKRRLKVDNDLGAVLLGQLASQLRGERLDGVVRSGDRLNLMLPFCDTCRAKQRLADRLKLVALLAPIWLVVGLLAFAMISMGGLGVLLALGGTLYAGLRYRWLAATYEIQVERIDGDGILRMRPVHPDAAQAILAAAGMSS